MVKFKIFEKRKKEEEKEIYFKLEKDSDFDINLIVCDKNGKYVPAGIILCIQNNGTLSKCRNINTNLGLELDKNGIIIEED